jgi:two-component system phosphate regulon response regulator PhoB
MNTSGYFLPRASNKTVLVVVREPEVRELIAASCRFAGFYPVQADSRTSGRLLIAQVLPDAVVVDLDSPEAAGLDFAADVKTLGQGRRIPIVMLTARPAESCGSRGAVCGADDCVSKPFVPSDLVARLARLLGGAPASRSPGRIVAGPLELDPTEHTVTAHGLQGGEQLTLPAAEFRLLHHFMLTPERVHGREQLLAKVWRDQHGLDARTVDQTVKRLRLSLAAAGLQDLIETVRGVGYRFAARVPERTGW